MDERMAELVLRLGCRGHMVEEALAGQTFQACFDVHHTDDVHHADMASASTRAGKRLPTTAATRTVSRRSAGRPSMRERSSP